MYYYNIEINFKNYRYLSQNSITGTTLVIPQTQYAVNVCVFIFAFEVLGMTVKARLKNHL